MCGYSLVEGAPAEHGPYTVLWESDVDGILYVEDLPEVSSVSLTSNSLTAGTHTVYVKVTAASGEMDAAAVQVGICGWQLIDDFEDDIDTNNWLLHRDAYRDSRGWLEMTGNVQDKKGAIFYTGQELQPGNLKIKFDISTGQCDEPDVSCTPTQCDADGFAVSIYKTKQQFSSCSLTKQHN